MRLKALVLVFALVIFASMPTKATIIDVPGDSSTIQGGINGASNGDTVLVAKGHYYERISFKGKAILVASDFIYDGSPATIDSTIIDGDPDSLGVADTGSVVRFVNQEDSNSIIKGFTIQNGIGTQVGIYPKRHGGGVFCDSTSPTISYNTITDNSAYWGGGIGCYRYSSPVIRNNTIIRDSTIQQPSYGDGGGICCFLYSSPIIDSNLITDNWGGGISCWNYCAPLITNNTISDNRLHGGIFCYSGSPTISDNSIKENSAWEGGGISFWWYCSAVVDKNIIANNSATLGGGIFCTDTYISPTITNNTINKNSASRYGGGIYMQDWSAPVITNNIISNSTNGEGIFCNYNHNNPSISFNDVWNNYDGNFSGCPPGVGDTTWGTNFFGTPCDSFYNIVRDPSFADTVNYTLICSSLCIEAGDSISTPPAKSGCRVDIGAFEFYHGFICGDVDSSGIVNSTDCDYLTNYLFRSGPAPRPLASGDVNHDGNVNVGDLVYLINYVYKSGPPPCCPACL